MLRWPRLQHCRRRAAERASRQYRSEPRPRDRRFPAPRSIGRAAGSVASLTPGSTTHTWAAARGAARTPGPVARPKRPRARDYTDFRPRSRRPAATRAACCRPRKAPAQPKDSTLQKRSRQTSSRKNPRPGLPRVARGPQVARPPLPGARTRCRTQPRSCARRKFRRSRAAVRSRP